MASAPVLKPIAMANCFLTSRLTAKPSLPFLAAIPPPPIRLSLAASHPLLTVRKSTHFTSLVAQTSDWAQEDVAGDVVETEGEGEGVGEESSAEEPSYPEPPEEAKLFVGNIPYDMDSEKLANLFDKAGVVEVAEVIYNRETDQSRGFGFVTMSTVEEAERAVEMLHRYDINGRNLTVNKAAPRGSRPERPRESDPSLRVYVGNLPWQVDDSRLEQLFSEHGKVIDARVVYDRESGRSRGFGFVTLATREEVDDAIAALDGQSLEGRALRVNVAEERPRRSSF